MLLLNDILIILYPLQGHWQISKEAVQESPAGGLQQWGPGQAGQPDEQQDRPDAAPPARQAGHEGAAEAQEEGQEEEAGLPAELPGLLQNERHGGIQGELTRFTDLTYLILSYLIRE